MSKYEPIIRKISLLLMQGEREKATHHMKRIWNKQDDMTITEQYVLREIGIRKHIKF